MIPARKGESMAQSVSMAKEKKGPMPPHWRKGHWRTNPVTGQKEWIDPQLITDSTTTAEEKARIIADSEQRAKKAKRSAAAKKAWETIRRKKAESEEEAKKKKYRSIDDEGKYGEREEGEETA